MRLAVSGQLGESFWIPIDAAHDTVSRHGWLSLTPDSFRQAVLERCRYMEVSTGAAIYAAGDPPGGLYGLVWGGLQVSISVGDRIPYLAHLLRPGMWAGEGSAITGQPRLIGLSAARQSGLLYLPLHAIHELVSRSPESWRFIALLSFENFRTALVMIDDLMIRDDVRRFTAVLLHLGGCREITPSHSGPIEIHVNQENLAAMANLARTTVGTALRRFEVLGLVHLAYRRIVILQPDKLRTTLVE